MDTSSDLEKTIDAPVSNQQPAADQPLKNSWKVVKIEEATAALIAVKEMALHDFSQAVDHATNDLMVLVEQFDNLSLTGSVLAQMRRAVRLMEDEFKEVGIGRVRLIAVQKHLHHMK